MKKENFRKTAAVLLAILGMAMIIIGLAARLLPPALTGVGFIIIAVAFWSDRKN